MKNIDLGLKASSDEQQIADRLKYHPNVFEFYTSETDFSRDGLKKLAYAIDQAKDSDVKQVILHHPMRYQEYFTELLTPEDKLPQLYRFIEQSSLDLLQLGFDKDVQVLIHGSYSRQTNEFLALYPNLSAAEEYVYQRLDHFQELGKEHVMFENSISPIFYYGDAKIDDYILAKNYRLAFDTSHCFIKWRGDNEKLVAALTHLRENVVHYHLVDSLGATHDSLEVGKGKIDWQRVLPLLNENATNIFEIVLKDQNDASEQVNSYKYLQNLKGE